MASQRVPVPHPAPPLRFPNLQRVEIIRSQRDALEVRRRELNEQLEAVDGQVEMSLREPPPSGGAVGQLVLPQDSVLAMFDRQEAEGSAKRLRHELRQLQWLSDHAPSCTICEQRVGPVHLLVGLGDDQHPLCLDCLGGWAAKGLSGEFSPAEAAGLLAIKAVEEESKRRIADDAGRPRLRVVGDAESDSDYAPVERTCWNCGRSVDMVVTDQTGATASATLEVAGLVLEGSAHDAGAVCMWCIGSEIGGLKSWVVIERTLSDPEARRRARAKAAQRRRSH